MKIIDLLKKETLSLSFEVFPPKTDTAFENVRTATEEIAKLRPAFMSVTYGAGGGTSKYTLDIAKQIKERYDVPSLAHLTCVSSSKETVRERIEDIKAADGTMIPKDGLIEILFCDTDGMLTFTTDVPFGNRLR